jgi:hypothetical protein
LQDSIFSNVYRDYFASAFRAASLDSTQFHRKLAFLCGTGLDLAYHKFHHQSNPANAAPTFAATASPVGPGIEA